MAETNQPSDQNGDMFQVSGMGFTALLRSKDIILPIFYALLVATMFYMLSTQHAEQNQQFALILQQLQKANELQYLQTWQLSRPQEERLPITPPPQLWKYVDPDAVKPKASTSTGPMIVPNPTRK